MYLLLKNRIGVSLLLLLLSFGLKAQEVWTLERCIKHAQENNIGIKQAVAGVRTAALAEKQAKAARLPNVSASFSGGEQFGRTIDPTSNQFSTSAVGFNGLDLDAGISLFSGGQIHHGIKQAGWDLKASEADAQQSVNDLSLRVAAAYLNVLLSEEQLENAQRRVTQSQKQLEITQKLIDAGSAPMVDKFNITAQLARDEQAAVTVQNTVDLNYLMLKQLLQLEPDVELRVERPEISVPVEANPQGLSLPALYQTATGTQAGIRAADFRIKSAEEGIKVSKGAYYPSLNFGVNLSSNYSTQFRLPNNVISWGDAFPVLINNEQQQISFLQSGSDKVGYFDQLNQNFGQGLFFNLRIPLYQNGRARLNVERARLGLINAQLQQNQVQQQLKNDIQTAIANARAGKLQLEAAQKTFDAMQLAYQNTEKRHTLGAVNTLDLTLAKTNRDNAENDLLIARYDYIFRMKIIDFYEGKTLELNR